MDFQESQTYINLQVALKELLETNTLLEIFEAAAAEEVLIPINFLFNTTARNVRYIAIYLYSILYGETSTLENLQVASIRENEGRLVYLDYSDTAIEEGFDDIASLFNGISNIMLNHSIAYDNAILDIENGTLYCQPGESLWICLGCGNILSGICAPDICPVCGVSGRYYRRYTATNNVFF